MEQDDYVFEWAMKNPIPEIKNQGESCCLGSFHFITASPPVS